MPEPKPISRVYDAFGYCIAIECFDGTRIPNIYTHVGEPCVSWVSESPLIATFYEDGNLRPVSESTRRRVVGTITWDGACHAQLTGWWESKAPGAPRGGVPSMYAKGGKPWQTAQVEGNVV